MNKPILHNRPNHAGGFTLVEVLTATIIAGFIAASATAVLRGLVTGREKLSQNLELAAELRYAGDMIRKDLANIFRIGNDRKFIGVNEDTGAHINSRIIFNAVNSVKARNDRPEADLYQIEYRMAEKDEQTLLMRRLWPNPHADEEPLGMLSVVSKMITGFQVSYFDGNKWLVDWPEELNQIPQLVSITLVAHHPQREDPTINTILVHFPRLYQNSSGEADMNLAGELPEYEND